MIQSFCSPKIAYARTSVRMRTLLTKLIVVTTLLLALLRQVVWCLLPRRHRNIALGWCWWDIAKVRVPACKRCQMERRSQLLLHRCKRSMLWLSVFQKARKKSTASNCWKTRRWRLPSSIMSSKQRSNLATRAGQTIRPGQHSCTAGLGYHHRFVLDSDCNIGFWVG